MRVVRLTLYFVVGLFLGGSWTLSHAAVPIRLALPANVAGSVGSYVTSAAANFAGASFNSGLTAQVGGRAVVVSAAWRLAANAPSVASQALWANPVLLGVAAVAAWAAHECIDYQSGSWVLTCGQPNPPIPADGYKYQTESWMTGQYAHSASEACSTATAWINANGGASNTYATVTCNAQTLTYSVSRTNAQGTISPYVVMPIRKLPDVCPTSWFWVDGQCVQTAPANRIDQNTFTQKLSTLPDPVASGLAGQGVPLPLQNPQINTNPQYVPLGDPWYDPVTKTWKQTIGIVSPGASMPPGAAVKVGDQKVDPNGTPVPDPDGDPVVTNPDPDPKSVTGDPPIDPCSENSNRLGCLDTGEPDDIDLGKQDINVGITPVSGFGASDATCPADQTYTLRTGQVVSQSFAPVCQMARSFRPVVIGMAWLSAALIFLGIQKRNA